MKKRVGQADRKGNLVEEKGLKPSFSARRPVRIKVEGRLAKRQKDFKTRTGD